MGDADCLSDGFLPLPLLLLLDVVLLLGVGCNSKLLDCGTILDNVVFVFVFIFFISSSCPSLSRSFDDDLLFRLATAVEYFCFILRMAPFMM